MSVAENVKNTETTKNNNGLLVGNPVYKPFRYPWCYDAWPVSYTHLTLPTKA